MACTTQPNLRGDGGLIEHGSLKGNFETGQQHYTEDQNGTRPFSRQ